MQKSEVGKKDGSEAGVPNRESKPSAHAPAPHARHDRSMARSRSVGRPIFENFLTFCPTPASNVHCLQGCCRAGIVCFYNGFAVDMEWTWHPNARFTLQKYGFREFMILSSLKNRLRSRTRVATFKFQNALGLKNRLRSRTHVTTFKFLNALGLKNRLRSRTRVTIFKFQNASCASRQISKFTV